MTRDEAITAFTRLWRMRKGMQEALDKVDDELRTYEAYLLRPGEGLAAGEALATGDGSLVRRVPGRSGVRRINDDILRDRYEDLPPSLRDKMVLKFDGTVRDLTRVLGEEQAERYLWHGKKGDDRIVLAEQEETESPERGIENRVEF